MNTPAIHVHRAPPVEAAWQWAVCPDCLATFPVTELTEQERATALQQERAIKAFLLRAALLSDRERQIMLSIARGEMPAKAAKRLNLSVKTIHTYRCRVQEKLELRSSAAIAVAVYRAGMLK